MTSEFDDTNFLCNYRNSRLQENIEEPFSRAIFKKKCMILALAHSSKSLDNATSCHIFEDQLQDYCRLVDNRNGINNFAKATLDLMSNVKNVSKSWKSGLANNSQDSPWKYPEGKCLNPSIDGVCGNALPPSSLVHQLLGPSELPKKTLDQPKCGDNYLKMATGGERKSLYLSYSLDSNKTSNKIFPPVDGQNKPSFPSSHSNFVLKQRKETVNSSHVETKANPVMKSDISSDDIQTKESGYDNKRKKYLYSTYSEQNQDGNYERSGVYHKFPGGKGYCRNSKPLFAAVGFQNSCGSEHEEESHKMNYENHFKTAGQELKLSNQKKFGNQSGGERAVREKGYGFHERNTGFQPQTVIKKSLGGKRSVSSKFVPPVRNSSQEDEYSSRNCSTNDPECELDERLKNIDPKMVELIQNEIMDSGSKVDWNDIAGLDFAKATIQEIVVWPMLRPDIFTGLRRPPKGILLFGPPGTGKTLIGKCIASQSKSTFFSISASSLTSKWIGDGEKMVRALFAVARVHQPAVVFIDEIDSLLSQRSDTEHESSRRIKTEFLVQLDGAATGEEDRILVIGATNRPQELDEAARRRLVKRLYIPLPDQEARKQLTQNLMKLERNDLTTDDIEEIANLTDGYSGADMKNLCQEASLGPIRSISSSDMFQISAEQVRPVNIGDFKMALRRVKSSVSSEDLEQYVKWDLQFGSGAFSS